MDIMNLKTMSGSSPHAMPVGSKKPIAVDISSTDYTVTVQARLITATSGTVIVVDMECADGAITGVKIPPNMPIFNVTKIIKSGTDAENIYIWPTE